MAAPAAAYSFVWDDVSPHSGLPLFRSLWRDLPGPVCDMAMDVWGWTPRTWDERVRAGDLAEYLDWR